MVRRNPWHSCEFRQSHASDLAWSTQSKYHISACGESSSPLRCGTLLARPQLNQCWMLP